MDDREFHDCIALMFAKPALLIADMDTQSGFIRGSNDIGHLPCNDVIQAVDRNSSFIQILNFCTHRKAF